MDLLEQFLAGDEENLCSCALEELKKIVQLLADQVRSKREELCKTKAEVQNQEAETAKRSLSREFLVSQLAQIMDLQEALEEEEKMQQQLQAVTHEMERFSEARGSESCDALEMRIKEAEDFLSTCCQQEKALLAEVEILKTSLEKSQATLGQTASERQAVETELLALQNTLSAQSRLAHGEAALVLSACIEEMGLQNVIPGKLRKK
ncbi:uncharacterized protein LOC121007484 [Bufo bufo]|uniref:uncharacterized protein LOC121007484 n=1 Tax=Bufo bufo TaxID=8384 RepID=UPI001ABE8FEA|nr:uncharacterized protein LOC121007484 [Bufo bufo]